MKVDKRAHIPGLTGLFHPACFERLKGLHDGAGQVRQTDNGYSSPHIEWAHSCFDAVMNRTYLQATKELEPLFSEAAHDVRELGVLCSPEKAIDEAISGEEAARKNSAKTSKQLSNIKREREIVIRLGELRSEIVTADETVSHYCHRLEALLKSRLSRYWDGVLKASGDNALPPYPLTEARPVKGQDAFCCRVKEAISQIESALCDWEKEGC